jgi:hypothetical protein
MGLGAFLIAMTFRQFPKEQKEQAAPLLQGAIPRGGPASGVGHRCYTLTFLSGGQERFSPHDQSEPLTGHHGRNET